MNTLVLPCAFGRAVVLTALTLSAACATEMVYTPINPSFGGNPNNGPVLLNNAQAQNSFHAPALSAIDRFNQNLQSAILSHLLSDSIKTMFGSNTSLTPGTYDTGNYTVTVTDLGGGNLQIDTTDKTSGATATFSISPLAP